MHLQYTIYHTINKTYIYIYKQEKLIILLECFILSLFISLKRLYLRLSIFILFLFFYCLIPLLYISLIYSTLKIALISKF